MSVVDESLHRAQAASAPGPAADTAGAEAATAVARSASEETIHDHPVQRGQHVAECAAWSIVWLAVITAGVDVCGFWWASPLVGALGPLMVLAGTAGVIATWTARTPRSPLLQRCAFGAVVASVLFPQAIIIHTRVFVSTDSAAFDQASARALLHGHDPYTASFAGVARMFSVPARFWTYTVDGGHVTHASYPAGSFLVDVPAMALGLHHMVVDWTDLVAWVLCIGMFFVLLPVSLRWLAGLLALTPVFLGMFSSGGTDAVFLPFLVLAVWRWDRYRAEGVTGVARWVGPVALGLACAVKQTPWFCVPFLVTGVAMEARVTGQPALGRGARYLATVVGVFVVVNLPFIVWQPSAWARGTLLPLRGGLVTDGQGIVALATHGVTGGVDIGMLSAAAALVYLALLASWTRWYPVLKRVWVLAIPLALFFSPRSLSSYLVDLVPVAVIAAVTVHGVTRPIPMGLRLRRLGVAGVVAASTGALVACSLAFVTHPLSIAIDHVQVAPGGRHIDAVTVTVTNLTDAPQRPHFTVNPGAGTAGYWLPVQTSTPSGSTPSVSLVLGPRRSATVTLDAPVSTTAPQHGARWLVEAYTASPSALSTSALQVWSGP